MQVGRILIPVDGSGASEDALVLACQLAKRGKEKVYVAYVIEVERSLPIDAELDPEIKRGEEVLNYAEHVAKEQDCEVETDLLQAREAGPAIVEEAVERGIDLIILGTEYKERFGKFAVGDVVSYVFRNAPCSVLLYRQPVPSKEATVPSR